MTPHERIRHDQSLALRDSLLGSSFSWLTLAVAAMIWLSLQSPPIVDEPPTRIWDFPERDDKDYVPAPDVAPQTKPIVTPPTIHGELVPVLDPTFQETILDSPATLTGALVGSLLGQGHADVRPGGGGEAIGSGVIPDAKTWIFHEVAPEAVKKVLPVYPELAREARLEGRVVVRAFVGTDGRVRRAEIEQGSAVFDRAAVEAVERWIFTPALANGRAVAVWIRVPIVFRLD